MLGVKHFLQRQESTPTIVERAWDDALARIACYGAQGHCPTVLVEARAVGYHSTPAIVAVGIGYASSEAGSIVFSVSENVGRATNVAKAKAYRLRGISHTATLERLVHTANH